MAMKVRYTTVRKQIISLKDSGGRKVLVPDRQGSTTYILNTTPSATDAISYWPYGEVAAQSGGSTNRFKFIGSFGYAADTASRTYVRFRSLTTARGRWLSVDSAWPVEPSYSYSAGNPTTLVDPSGLRPTDAESLAWYNSCTGLYNVRMIGLTRWLSNCSDGCVGFGDIGYALGLAGIPTAAAIALAAASGVLSAPAVILLTAIGATGALIAKKSNDGLIDAQKRSCLEQFFAAQSRFLRDYIDCLNDVNWARQGALDACVHACDIQYLNKEQNTSSIFVDMNDRSRCISDCLGKYHRGIYNDNLVALGRLPICPCA